MRPRLKGPYDTERANGVLNEGSLITFTFFGPPFRNPSARLIYNGLSLYCCLNLSSTIVEDTKFGTRLTNAY